MGQDVSVYRTETGTACAVNAYCPHLGAHFGFGGKIVGENLRCPFHGFQYDTRGICVSTGYGTRPPPWMTVTGCPCSTENSFCMTIPRRRPRTAWILGTSPWSKKYRNPRMLRETQVNGHYMSTAYCVSRHVLGLEKLFPNIRFEFEFDTDIYGFGYSQVDVRIPRMDMEIRLWVLPTPIEEGRITLNLTTSAKIVEPGKIHPLCSLSPESC